VRIERGPFAQMTGTIATWSSAERVRLLVWMLGRETVVEVRGADIVAAASRPFSPQSLGITVLEIASDKLSSAAIINVSSNA